MREGRVLSRSSPSKPSAAKRSCQRHTQVLDLPVRRMISIVPTPSALNSTISARQTCFCGVFRSLTSAVRRRRSVGETMKDYHHRAAGEVDEGVLEGAQGLDVEVVVGSSSRRTLPPARSASEKGQNL